MSGHPGSSASCQEEAYSLRLYGFPANARRQGRLGQQRRVEQGGFPHLSSGGVATEDSNPAGEDLTLGFNLLDGFGHHGGVVMDNAPPPVTPFVDEGIPRFHRFGGAWRLARE